MVRLPKPNARKLTKIRNCTEKRSNHFAYLENSFGNLKSDKGQTSIRCKLCPPTSSIFSKGTVLNSNRPAPLLLLIELHFDNQHLKLMTVMDSKYTLPGWKYFFQTSDTQLYAEWSVMVEQQLRDDMWYGCMSEPHQVLQDRRLMKLNWTTTCKLKNVQYSQDTVRFSTTTSKMFETSYLLYIFIISFIQCIT